MLPADQRLDANDQSALQADQRLVMQDELAVDQGAPQVAFHHQALEGRLVHVRRIETEGIAPHLLGLVHRRIGVAQQVFHVPAVLRAKADAQRLGEGQFMPADLEGLGAILQQTTRHIGRRRGMEPRQGEDEFVAAKAGQGIDPPDGRFQPLGDGTQEVVTDAMPERIVDPLEMVEIDHHQRKRRFVAFDRRQHLPNAIAQHTVVGKTGQGIEVGQLPDLHLGPFLRRNIENRTDRRRATLK